MNLEKISKDLKQIAESIGKLSESLTSKLSKDNIVKLEKDDIEVARKIAKARAELVIVILETVKMPLVTQRFLSICIENLSDAATELSALRRARLFLEYEERFEK